MALAAALGSSHCGARHTVLPAPEPVPHATDTASLPLEPAREPAPIAGSSQRTAPMDFDGVVRPILEARCRPCHFPDGRMYDRLPFDRPETIRELGERLFTRIDDPEEQAVIRAFLGLPP